MSAVSFPPQLHVFVRDWLSANNVLLQEPRRPRADRHRLRPPCAADAGAARVARAASAASRSRGSSTRTAIRTTSAATPRSSPSTVVPSPCRAVRRRSSSAGTTRRCCTTTATSAPTASRWTRRWVPTRRTSGATSNGARWPRRVTTWSALVFHNPEHGILVSGDALWENGFGFVMPPEIRSGGAAGDARDDRHDRGARRPRRDPRARRAVHGRGRSALDRARRASRRSRPTACASRATRSR